MSDTTALDAAKSAIRRNISSRHLYAPSVLDEATELTAKFYAAGKEHQIEAGDWDNVTSFASAALDALAGASPSTARPLEQLAGLRAELVTNGVDPATITSLDAFSSSMISACGAAPELFFLRITCAFAPCFFSRMSAIRSGSAGVEAAGSAAATPSAFVTGLGTAGSGRASITSRVTNPAISTNMLSRASARNPSPRTRRTRGTCPSFGVAA